MSDQKELGIIAVDRHDGNLILVSFSDGTYAIYTVQQLAELTPERIRAEQDSG